MTYPEIDEVVEWNGEDWTVAYIHRDGDLQLRAIDRDFLTRIPLECHMKKSERVIMRNPSEPCKLCDEGTWHGHRWTP